MQQCPGIMRQSRRRSRLQQRRAMPLVNIALKHVLPQQSRLRRFQQQRHMRIKPTHIRPHLPQPCTPRHNLRRRPQRRILRRHLGKRRPPMPRQAIIHRHQQRAVAQRCKNFLRIHIYPRLHQPLRLKRSCCASKTSCGKRSAKKATNVPARGSTRANTRDSSSGL